MSIRTVRAPASGPVAASSQPSADATRTEALRLHRAGRLDEAAGLYRVLLARDARAFDVLVLLSVLEHGRGNATAALDLAARALQERRSPEALLQHAVALRACGRDRESLASYDEALLARPDLGAALYNRANLLRSHGRHEEALADYDRLLAIDPDDLGALNNRAVTLLELGRLEASLRNCEAVLLRRPAHVGALTNRGNVLRRLGRLAEAIESYSTALQFAARDAGALANRAGAHNQLGRFEEALDDAEAALAIEPAQAAALNHRALALIELGRAAEALSSCDAALVLQPDDADVLNTQGMALQRLGRHADALASHGRALALAPDASKAVNLGNALLALDRADEALASYDEALSMEPEHPGAWSNRGHALQVLQRHQEALASYRRAVELAPEDPDAHWNEGLCRLALGDYERGWALYESRLARRTAPDASAATCPRLMGDEDLAGRTVLVHTEQGHGDAIQFIRFVPLLAARGARIVLACHRSLHRLFASVAGVEAVLGPEGLPRAPDYHVPLLSLPHVLKASGRPIPADVPYLRCSAQQQERWREKVASHGPGLRIGIAWAGNPDFPGASRKSMPLDALLPLLGRDVRFFSLQKGPAAGEIAQLGLAGRIVDLSAELESFDDTAALVSELDLVVSVDTAVAHLAGALGKPVWILLQHAADWRWLVARDDSPWYPTARLFRQARPREWRDVVSRVNQSLEAFVSP